MRKDMDRDSGSQDSSWCLNKIMAEHNYCKQEVESCSDQVKTLVIEDALYCNFIVL